MQTDNEALEVIGGLFDVQFGVDNDNDLLVDEPGKRRSESFGSAYPEIGAHFWLTPRVRMTANAAYHVTSTGRDDDQWTFGIGISVLSPTDYAVVPNGKFSLLEQPESWQPESWQPVIDPLHDSRDYSTRAPGASPAASPIERTPDGRPLPPL